MEAIKRRLNEAVGEYNNILATVQNMETEAKKGREILMKKAGQIELLQELIQEGEKETKPQKQGSEKAKSETTKNNEQNPT